VGSCSSCSCLSSPSWPPSPYPAQREAVKWSCRASQVIPPPQAPPAGARSPRRSRGRCSLQRRHVRPGTGCHSQRQANTRVFVIEVRATCQTQGFAPARGRTRSPSLLCAETTRVISAATALSKVPSSEVPKPLAVLGTLRRGCELTVSTRNREFSYFFVLAFTKP